MKVKAVQTRGADQLQVLLELTGDPEPDTQTVLRLLQAWRNDQEIGLEVDLVEEPADDEPEASAEPDRRPALEIPVRRPPRPRTTPSGERYDPPAEL